MAQLLCFSPIFLQNWKFFFNFCQKMTEFFFLKLVYFFHRINATVGVTTPTVRLKILSRSFTFFFLVFIQSYFTNHSTPTFDFCTIHTRACILCFRVNSEFLSSLIFFLRIYKLSGRYGWEWNFENSISEPLRFLGFAKHYTCKSHELTYHWYKGREVNAKHPVHCTHFLKI